LRDISSGSTADEIEEGDEELPVSLLSSRNEAEPMADGPAREVEPRAVAVLGLSSNRCVIALTSSTVTDMLDGEDMIGKRWIEGKEGCVGRTGRVEFGEPNHRECVLLFVARWLDTLRFAASR
jgi:hypothetical protein